MVVKVNRRIVMIVFAVFNWVIFSYTVYLSFFLYEIECKITRMQLLLCFNLVIKTMRHLPNYHFCHKNLVQSIDFLPSSGIHRHCHREICLYLLATKKKINIWQRTQCTCPTETERNKNSVTLLNGAWWQSISNPHFFLNINMFMISPCLTHSPNVSGVTQNK